MIASAQLRRELFPDFDVRCRSVLESGLEKESVDAVVCVGGLHHMHPHLEETIGEFLRVLKPGGSLYFMEPHSGSVLDLVRKLWYRLDDNFAENEASIDVDDLKSTFGEDFEFLKISYQGSCAHLLVSNSRIFKVPLWLKGLYSPLLIWLESILNTFGSKWFSSYVLCHWRKVTVGS
jgi:SAM-dependent methyltransferase